MRLHAILLSFLLSLLLVRGASCQDFLAADFNSDGNVDFHDFVILAKNFPLKLDNASHKQGDIDGDGRLGFLEGVAFHNFYGGGMSPRTPSPMNRNVVLIADDQGQLFFYTRNNILPTDRLVLFGYSIESEAGSLVPRQLSPTFFDAAWANEPTEVTVGSMGPAFPGLRMPMCCSVRLLDTRYDAEAGIDDLTFFFGTIDGSFEGPVVPGLPGDADLDGTVQFTDFLLLSSNFGMPGEWGDGDFDDDGEVAFGDFLILSQHFHQSMTPGLRPVAVPEANGLLFFVAAMATLVRRRSACIRPRSTACMSQPHDNDV